MRLNRFIANAGICSRREADKLIKAGLIKVNGEIIDQMGVKVSENDEIEYKGKVITGQAKIYYLLNKPKGYITTVKDERGRSTVLDLIENAYDERIYPVGRLDKDTTGLLLLTNDGDLTQHLTHPSNKVRKVYEVKLDKPLTQDHFDKINKGLMLEDGKAIVDKLYYHNENDLDHIVIELHMGKNRIVRRIFESLDYKVKALDRMIYGSLTKKRLPRKKYRKLSEKEVVFLKHFT